MVVMQIGPAAQRRGLGVLAISGLIAGPFCIKQAKCSKLSCAVCLAGLIMAACEFAL
jgi:hypothetical protein